MTRRTLLGLVFLLMVTLALATPYGVGVIAERHFQDLIITLDQDPQIHVVSQSYERGYRKSQAVVVLEWVRPRRSRGLGQWLDRLGIDQRASVPLTMKHQIDHGPMWRAVGASALGFGAGRIQTAISLPPDLQQQLAGYFPDGAVLTTQGEMTFAGRLNGHFDVPAYQGPIHGQPGGAVAWEPAKLAFTLTPHSQILKTSVAWPRLTISLPDGQRIQVDGLGGDGEMRPGPSGIYLGRYTVRMDAISGQSGGDTATNWRAESVESIYDVDQNGELINLGQKLRLTGLEWAQERLGPGNLELRLENLDPIALAGLRRRLLQARSGGLNAALVVGGFDDLVGLLAASPRFEIKEMVLMTPDGEVRGHGEVAFAGGGNVPLFDIRALIGRTHAAAGLSLPEQVLLDVLIERSRWDLLEEGMPSGPELDAAAARWGQARFDELVSRGVWLREGGRLKSEIELKNANLLINGQLAGELGNVIPDALAQPLRP